MNEKELAAHDQRGLGLVLMKYEDERVSYKDVPARVVLVVDDVGSLATSVAAREAAQGVSAPAADAHAA